MGHCLGHWLFNPSKLIVIQKKTVRIIAGAKYRAPTDSLFSDLGILKFVDVSIYTSLCYSCFVFITIWYQTNFKAVYYNSDIHAYDTRESNQLHIPSVKKKIGKRCIKYDGFEIWNNVIKLNIPRDTSEAGFKILVKKEMVRGAWLFIFQYYGILMGW